MYALKFLKEGGQRIAKVYKDKNTVLYADGVPVPKDITLYTTLTEARASGVLHATTTKSQVISIIGLLFILSGLISAYIFSLQKDEIDFTDKSFSISQALAYGNKWVMIPLLIIGYTMFIYLILLRGPQRFIYIRLFLLAVMLILIITIMWITPEKNPTAHFSLAGVIFGFNILFSILTIYVFSKHLSSCHFKIMMFTLFCNIIILTLLAIFGGLMKNKNITYADLFSSCEELTVILTSFTIMFIGFL